MAERRSRGLSFGFGWGRRYDDDNNAALARTPGTTAGQTGEPQPRPARSGSGDALPAEPVPREGSVSLEPARTIEEEFPVWEGKRTGTPDDEAGGWKRRAEGSWGRRIPETPGIPEQSPRGPEDRRFPDPEEARLLCRIQEAEFRAIDWMLAADLRPHDRETLSNYNEAARQVHELMHQYEERFGAFMWMHANWPARRHTGPFAVTGQEYFEEEPV